MLKGKLILWLASAMLIWTTAISQAATLSLSPSAQDVQPGDQVVLKLTMDFSDDPTIGGGVDIFYDSSLLSFDSFVFDAGLGDDPGFRYAPNDLGGELDGLAFGNFRGLSGPVLVGTLTFKTLGAGQAGISLAENDSNRGGFYSAVAFGHQNVSFENAKVTIVSGATPVTKPDSSPNSSPSPGQPSGQPETAGDKSEKEDTGPSIKETKKSPAITRFSSGNGKKRLRVASKRTVVTIFGKNFSTVKEENIVKFGKVKAKVIFAHKKGKKLKVKVPKKARTSFITVTVDGKTAKSKTKFKVKKGKKGKKKKTDI